MTGSHSSREVTLVDMQLHHNVALQWYCSAPGLFICYSAAPSPEDEVNHNLLACMLLADIILDSVSLYIARRLAVDAKIRHRISQSTEPDPPKVSLQ